MSVLYLRFLFKSSYAFRTLEWFNLARDDVVRLRRTPPLVSSFGWFWSYISPLFPCLVTSALEDGDGMFRRNFGVDQHINTAPNPKN
jgi:hypothetical protein